MVERSSIGIHNSQVSNVDRSTMTTAAELAAYDHQVHEVTIAMWTPAAVAVLFLAARLYIRFSRLGSWLMDDWMLLLAITALVIGDVLVSVSFASDISNDDGKRHFFTYHQASSAVLFCATTWSKCAFILTLWGLTSGPGARLFLVFLMATSHLLLVVGGIGIYAPACGDPKTPLRPYYAGKCLKEAIVRSLFLSPIVYGGVMDVVLSLYPWTVVRNLQLQKRERLGVAITMGLGALTGIIVILRSVLQFKKLVGRFDSLAFLQIFNTLEPAITIILQTIPIFRVLYKDARVLKSKYHLQSVPKAQTSQSRLKNTLSSKARISVADGYEDLEMVHLTVGPGGRVMKASTANL